MEGDDYARIFFRLSFPSSGSLSTSYLSIFFAKTVISASNKHSELLLRSARRTNGNARPSSSAFLRTYTLLFLRRLENQRFAIPISAFADALTRLLLTRFHPLPLFVSETFSSARLADARYAKVSVVLARRPIAITGRAE